MQPTAVLRTPTPHTQAPAPARTADGRRVEAKAAVPRTASAPTAAAGAAAAAPLPVVGNKVFIGGTVGGARLAEPTAACQAWLCKPHQGRTRVWAGM